MTAPAPVKLWRYSLPSIDGLEGWAIIHMDSRGFFATCSDYGNYAFHWRNWGDGRDFREFVIGLARDPYYIANKLDHDKWNLFDKDKTVERIRREIETAAQDGGLSAEDAQDEYERLELLESDEWEFSQWVQEQKMFDSCCDASDLAVTSPSADLYAFCTKTMPRLAVLLRQELDAEKAP